MDTTKCIKTRRSRRLFLDKDIPENKVIQILEAGINAPSSVDCQPWHFIIVKNKIKLEKLAKLKIKDGHKHILTAPLSIIVCVDIKKSPSRYLEDGVTATQNMLLMINELSLGSVYLSASKISKKKLAQEIRNILSIPETIMPITILPVGYFDSSEQLDNKELVNLKSITHYNQW